jgi:TonB-dependent receptor
LKPKLAKNVGCVVAAVAGQLWFSCAFANAIEFDIPSGNGDKSLLEFARQSGIDVVASSSQVHAIKTPAIEGTYDADVVLEMMLKGTGLKASRSPEGIVMISSQAKRNGNVCDEGEIMNSTSKLKATVSCLAMVFAGLQPAAAQTNGDAIETVVVTGIRQSLQQNLDIKRDSGGLVDAITMEDIGKFPDANLAAAMMRIPGITVTRASTVGFGMTSTGQATQITARGFGPAFNATLFDGRYIPSASGGRSFDFSVISSDLVQELDVLKTPDASLSSGGIGATINVKYPKPFDKKDSVFVASTSASYSPENGNFTPNGNALISQTFDGTKIGKIGFLVAGAYNDIKTTTRQASIWGWEGGYIDPCQYKGATTTCPTDTKNFALDSTKPIWYIQDYSADYATNDEQRINGRVAAQLQPIDTLEITAALNYSRYAYKANKWMYAIWNGVGDMRNIVTAPDGTITDFVRQNSPSDFDADIVTQVMQTYDYGLNAKWSVTDKLTLVADYDQALSSMNPGNQVSEKQADVGYGGSLLGSDIRIVVPGGRTLPYYASYGPNGNKEMFDDPSIIGSHTNQYLSARNRYLANQAKIEAQWAEDHWKAAVGIQYIANHYRTVNWNDATPGHVYVISYLNYGPASGSPTGVRLPSNVFNGTIPLGNLISGWNGSPVPDLVRLDVNAEYNYLEGLGDPYAKNIPGFYYAANTGYHGKFDMLESPTSLQTVNEDNLSPYVSGSAEFTMGDIPVVLNAGLRYENTRMKTMGRFQLLSKMEISSDRSAYLWTYQDQVSDVYATHNYSYFLPNLDMKFKIRDDMVLRVDASESLTRPGLNQLPPNLSVGGRTGSLTGSSNNPNLKPYLAKNFDIAEEWYFAPNSYFSIDTFFKQVSNFIVNGTTLQTDNGVIDPYTGQIAEFHVTSSVNGPMANVYGVELAFQYVFGDTGFGVQANGTLIDTNKQYNPKDLTTSGFAITGLANSFNAVAFYDKYGFEARIAANWRDTYLDHFGQMQNNSAFGTEPTFVEGNWSFDGSISYEINDNLTGYFEMNNILGSIYRTRGRFVDQPLDFVDYGRHMTFGVHYKL